jgi:hypothetical protein
LPITLSHQTRFAVNSTRYSICRRGLCNSRWPSRSTSSRQSVSTTDNNRMYPTHQHSCVLSSGLATWINRQYTVPPNTTTSGPPMPSLQTAHVHMLFWRSKHQQPTLRLNYPLLLTCPRPLPLRRSRASNSPYVNKLRFPTKYQPSPSLLSLSINS